MILLDTNVVSEIMRPHADSIVSSWLQHQDPEDLEISTIAEVRRGIWRLPIGKRRASLGIAFDGVMLETFGGVALPFDIAAADEYGRLTAERQKAGFNTNALDLMIAAIALTHNAKLATRNTRDFDGGGIELLNPWQATGPS